MKQLSLTFLCSSLEPGRDGVGDYVRRLAGELIRQGHQITAVALKDQYSTEMLEEIQDIEDTKLLVLRLPTSWTSIRRFEQAGEFVRKIDPDWISLQYVPFGFDAKGLPFGLDRYMKPLIQNRKWHIMFHELWVGMEVEASFKYKLWGMIQAIIARQLLSSNPLLIHTQSHTYQEQLLKVGCKAEFLPLFSNIPVANSRNIPKINYMESKEISLVLFGGIHPYTPVACFAQEAAQFARTERIDMKLIIVGRSGQEKSQWIAAWETVGIQVVDYGELSDNRISEVLHGSTFGLSTTAFAKIEKSGAVAAMRAHGLPVICVAAPCYISKKKELPVIKGIIEYQQGNIRNCLIQSPVGDSQTTVHSVGQQLSRALLTH